MKGDTWCYLAEISSTFRQYLRGICHAQYVTYLFGIFQHKHKMPVIVIQHILVYPRVLCVGWARGSPSIASPVQACRRTVHRQGFGKYRILHRIASSNSSTRSLSRRSRCGASGQTDEDLIRHIDRVAPASKVGRSPFACALSRSKEERIDCGAAVFAVGKVALGMRFYMA